MTNINFQQNPASVMGYCHNPRAALTSAQQTLLALATVGAQSTRREGDRGGDVNFYSPECAMMRQKKM